MPTRSRSTDVLLPASLPRHRAGVRLLHWFNALSWVVLVATGTGLMSAASFALFGTTLPRLASRLAGGPAHLLRFHVLWGLLWGAVIVPMFLVFKKGPREVLAEVRLTRDDVAWLFTKPLAMAGLRRQPLPPQDKYNAGQKLFAIFVLLATVLIIASGLVMTLHLGPADVGFGWTLERAGFGRSDNLAAIFYGRDFRVLRVMFTAIATAMVGVYFLDLAGIVPISSIGILDTYLVAQLAGGLLVGFGFIVGGWCPGTSIVGLVSGKIDALLFIGGLVVGSMLFTLGFDSFAPLQNAGAKGRVLLHEYFRVPSGVMVLAVALFAVASFWAVGKIEKALRARREAPVTRAALETEPGSVTRAAVEGNLS